MKIISKYTECRTKLMVGLLLPFLMAGCVTTQTVSNVHELDRLNAIDDEAASLISPTHEILFLVEELI